MLSQQMWLQYWFALMFSELREKKENCSTVLMEVVVDWKKSSYINLTPRDASRFKDIDDLNTIQHLKHHPTVKTLPNM